MLGLDCNNQRIDRCVKWDAEMRDDDGRELKGGLSGHTIATHVCCTKSIESGYCVRVWLGDGDVFVHMLISVASLVEDVLGF